MPIWGSLMTEIRSLPESANALVVLFALMPGIALAQEDAWGIFRASCLVPMQQVQQVRTSGLEFVDITAAAVQSIESFASKDGGFFINVLSEAGSGQTGCGLRFDPGSGLAVQDRFAASFRDWAAEAVARAVFALRDEPVAAGQALHPEIALRTDQTREPVLFVTLWRNVATGGWSASVRETDLES